jgi:hypothetical protein
LAKRIFIIIIIIIIVIITDINKIGKLTGGTSTAALFKNVNTRPQTQRVSRQIIHFLYHFY